MEEDHALMGTNGSDDNPRDRNCGPWTLRKRYPSSYLEGSETTEKQRTGVHTEQRDWRRFSTSIHYPCSWARDVVVESYTVNYGIVKESKVSTTIPS